MLRCSLLLLLVAAAQGVDIVWNTRWPIGGGIWIAEGEVWISADKDLMGPSPGAWYMMLTLDDPALSPFPKDMWGAIIDTAVSSTQLILTNQYYSNLQNGQTHNFKFHIRYDTNQGHTMTGGTVVWYGSSAGGGGSGTTTTTTTTTSTTTTTAETTTPTTTTTTGSSGNTYDYALALDLSLRFYEAQRSGYLPTENRISWRGDSATADGSDNGKDLTGGWYDAGDHVKFGLPMASSTVTLLYGMIYFSNGYTVANEYTEALRQIRWPLDYFLKCYDQQNQRFYMQVGNGHVDHSHWVAPEDIDGLVSSGSMSRPSFYVGNGKPTGGADVMGETAAALAAGSILFATQDPTYSTDLYNAATALYNLAKSDQATYNSAVPEAAAFYSSGSYRDNLAHAAAWIAKATSDTSLRTTYRLEAESFLDSGSIWAVSWDECRALVNFLLYDLGAGNTYRQALDDFLDSWRSPSTSDGGPPYTNGGLAYRDQWGSLRYSANTAAVALLAANAGIDAVDNRAWAEGQIQYMMGDSTRSYVVGLRTSSPERPHHRASSCDSVCTWDDFNANRPNPNPLNGALVGGPDINDNYADSRSDYQKNEVATDYNAGFTTALAGLLN